METQRFLGAKASVLTKQAYIELKWEASYWRSQHARQVEREAALKAQVAAREATVRDLTQRLYGTKSEKSAGPGESKPAKTRNRDLSRSYRQFHLIEASLPHPKQSDAS
jgi:hypothetical protein